MKTAMQELRCLVQSMLQNGGDDDLWAVLSHIDDKLEKEKEQMFYWFYGGGGLSAKDDFREEFEKNYNQTYNSKKECQHIVTRVENNIQECLGCGKIISQTYNQNKKL